MSDTRIACGTLEKFVFDILCRSGLDSQEAEVVAKVMVWTDTIGRSSHGLVRLPNLLKRFNHNLINSPCNAKFEKKSDAIYLLFGNNGPGQFLGHIAVEKAAEIAGEFGVGIVGVKDSNHFGAGSYYTQLAAEVGKISLVTTNSFPIVVPYGGISPVFGTNPFAFGAPVPDGRSILADFSTSEISGAAYRQEAKNKETSLQNSTVSLSENETGRIEKVNMANLMPMAGAKGYCMGLMVEILSGVLTGSAISNEIGSIWKDFTKTNRVGHLFIVIDIFRIIPRTVYFQRIEDLIKHIKEAKRRNEKETIKLPGETRWHHYKDNTENGVPLNHELKQKLSILADRLDLDTPW